MRSPGVIIIAVALACAAVVRPSAAQTAAPVASPAATAAPEKFKYKIMQRHTPDADAEVVVMRSPAKTTISAKSNYGTRVAGPPYGAGGPTYQYLNVTTDSVLTLLSSLDPLSYINTRHVDGPADLYFVTFPLGSAAKTIVPRSRPRDVALEADTKHYIIRDDTDLASLFALPLQMNAWHDGHLTGVVIARNTRGGSYTFTSSSPETRPKGIPPADLALQFDGVDHITEWIDPVTMVPDRIDLPDLSTTIVRAGISY
jgi:hypothetical protein